MRVIDIHSGLALPEHELRFTASRSSGPGGQHVNKANTRVTLVFDVVGSPSLTEEQRQRILTRLSTRISSAGLLRVVSQHSRSREANERAAVERFVELIRQALARKRTRTATRATAASRERRLVVKKERATVKRRRARPDLED